MSACADAGPGLIALGVAEVEPPCYAWRPLCAILARAGDESVHIWTSGSEDDPLAGEELPAEVFTARLEEGLVTRLDPPIPLSSDRVIVRLAGGDFTALPIEQVRRQRHAFLMDQIRAALGESDAARAAGMLDLARLAEDWHPLATVIQGGMALENRGRQWADPVIEELREIAPRLDLDIIRQALMWDDLPLGDKRDEWLGLVEVFSRQCSRPPATDDLFPCDHETLQAAVTLLTARELLGREIEVLRRVAHRELKRLFRAEQDSVGALLEAVREAVGLSSAHAALAELDRRLACLGEESDRVRKVIETRLRSADWERQAAALARVEATVERATRYEVWREAMTRLRYADVRKGSAPWQGGESRARELADFWGFFDERPPARLGDWARGAFGLAAPATDIADAEVDGCHVVSPRIPPAAFLDKERILSRGVTTRFAIAKALGFQALGLGQPGAHLSHTPERSGRMRATTDLERAANAFAVYFIAPRAAVCGLVGEHGQDEPEEYARAVEKVMREFGLTFSAAFPHVANCRRRSPPWEMEEGVSESVDRQAVEQVWEGERIAVPADDGWPGVPLERSDGFASLLARAVSGGRLPMDKALRLLGGPTDRALALLQARMQ